MAEREIAEASEKVDKLDRSDRTSENTSKDAVIGGDRKDHQKIHQEASAAKRQARDLMKDRNLAERLDKEYPLLSREEALAKYGGDYEKAISASKRTNRKVNQKVEDMRANKDTEG